MVHQIEIPNRHYKIFADESATRARALGIRSAIRWSIKSQSHADQHLALLTGVSFVTSYRLYIISG